MKEEEYRKIEQEKLFEDISSFQDISKQEEEGTMVGIKNAEKK
jgi:hypothetical protein